MKISAKGRYGLSAMIYLAQFATENCATVLKVSEDLGISKVYLEQVFALLKKSNLVFSIKGSSGGYQLSHSPEKITAFDILNAIEITLFEPTEAITAKNSSCVDHALQSLLWDELDNTVKHFLSTITLSELLVEAQKNQQGKDFMYFI